MPEMTYHEYGLLQAQNKRIAELQTKIEEQARLLGMSGEREARLLAEIERLTAELAQRLEQIRQHNENCEADCNYRRADATVSKYCEAHTSRGRDCPECPRQYILD